MYYKIDLSNYEPKEVPEYHTYNNFEFSSNELKWLEKELNNFQDSFLKVDPISVERRGKIIF